MNKRELRIFPYDWLIFGYCLLMIVLIAVFGRPFGN